tara:strand:+ start:28993 stop:29226 length:234 start_codon:yes stop_codon:yes gene_type:complete
MNQWSVPHKFNSDVDIAHQVGAINGKRETLWQAFKKGDEVEITTQHGSLGTLYQIRHNGKQYSTWNDAFKLYVDLIK